MKSPGELIEFWNRKVSQFDIWDLKMVQVWTVAWVLLIVKLFPQILSISVWWFGGVILLCAPYVIYIVWLRENGQHVAVR